MRFNWLNLGVILVIALLGGFFEIAPFICFAVGFAFGWFFPVIHMEDQDEVGK